jgi:phage recombination protein Bet
MNQIVPLRAGEYAMSGKQLDLIKRTVAKDCDAAEFDHFMHTASHLGLDPLRKQVLCVVFNKHDPKKRSMTIIVPQDGLRVIAARQKDYGPARDEPEIEYDDAIKSDLNPHGIVRAKVTLWKRYSDGWQPVVATAYWDEFAPIEEAVEWRENDQGKRYPHKTGEQKLADNWRRMGRVMITKCATCQALRAGWPDDFAGVYGEEEMQRAIVIDAASEVVAEYKEAERLQRVGTNDGLLFVFDPAAGIESVARGQIADRLTRYYEREAPDAQALIDFRQRNEASLKTFWAWAPGDALEVKKIQERRIGELIAAKKESAGAGGAYEDAGQAGATSDGAPGGAAPPAPF